MKWKRSLDNRWGQKHRSTSLIYNTRDTKAPAAEATIRLFILPLFCSPAAPWPPLSQMRPGLIISVTRENICEPGTCHCHKASPKRSRFNFSNSVSPSSSRYLNTLVIFSNLFVCQIIFWRLSFPAQRMETNLKLERFLCQAGLKRDGPKELVRRKSAILQV